MYHENQSGKATARNNRCWLYYMPGAVINNQSLSPLHADGVPRVPEQHFPGMLAKLECEITCTILDEEMNSPLRTQSQPRKWLKCFLQLITCIRSSSWFKTPPILSLSLIILLRCGIGPQTSPPHTPWRAGHCILTFGYHSRVPTSLSQTGVCLPLVTSNPGPIPIPLLPWR